MPSLDYSATEIATVITAFATICGLLLIYSQVRVAVTSFEHDHTRRRKKATFDMYNSLREKIRDEDFFFRGKFGDPLSNKDLTEILEDRDLRTRMTALLSMLERISVGAKNDIYDIGILNELSGTVLVQMYERYEPYITDARKKSPTYFTAYEWLTNEILQLRRKQ